MTKDHGYLNVSTSPEVDTLLLNVSSDTLQPKPATSAKERAETRPLARKAETRPLARKAECSCCRSCCRASTTSPRVNRSILRGRGRQQNIDPGEFEKIY